MFRQFLSICIFSTLMIVSYQTARGQAALLVLIFGDKVASEKFHLSLDAGANYSAMPGLDKQEARLNPYFGLGTFLKINDKWAFTPEFKPLSTRGAQNVKPISDYSTTLNEIEYTIAANYIDLPIMFQYRITPRLFISTGGQISFMVASKQIAEGKLIAGGNDVSIVENDIDLFNKQYYVIPFEMGYSLVTQRGGKGLDIKVRYNWGLTDMISNSAYGSSYGSTFQFFASFPFVNLPAEAKP
jgi:hypothetical protein